MTHLVISNRRIANATYFRSPEELETYLKLVRPEALIFAFWSWIVSPWMLDTYKCYGLHTGPLLEGRGRGGSPIENLKALGVTWTTLCAFEMDRGIDTGRVKLAIPFNINASKEFLIKCIDEALPGIVGYLTAKQPEIPAYFKRITDEK
jgi:methionyl-tRNA formyltransferase